MHGANMKIHKLCLTYSAYLYEHPFPLTYIHKSVMLRQSLNMTYKVRAFNVL